MPLISTFAAAGALAASLSLAQPSSHTETPAQLDRAGRDDQTQPAAPPEPEPTTSATMTMATEAKTAPSWRWGFDRVDLVSEDLGTWLHYDLPMAPHNVQAAGLRFVEQVKVSFRLPVEGLYAGASLSAQSLTYEHLLLGNAFEGHGLYATGGVQTRLLLPRGATAGVAWRWGRVRVGASLAAFSETSWARPNWQQWTFLPTLGVGVGAHR